VTLTEISQELPNTEHKLRIIAENGCLIVLAIHLLETQPVKPKNG
jgi:hypothetical protein